MKKLLLGLSIALAATQVSAQTQTTSPQTTSPQTMPGSNQTRPAFPATTTSPGTNNMNNNGTNPSNGTYPGSTYPNNTTSYPGTNTTTQPGMNTPGTGTVPRPVGTPATPNRTYSDRELINNNPNTTPGAGTMPNTGTTTQPRR